MGKKFWIIILAIIIATVIIIFAAIWGTKKYKTAVIQPGIDKLATQKIAIVYHPYNDGIKQIADIIKSYVGGDVYILEPFSDYPTSPQLRADRIKNEQLHPEKVSIKDNNFNLKKYDIVFIGVPVIEGDMSPIMKRFVLDNEKLFNKNIVTIPFVFMSNGDSAKSTFTFLFYHTSYSSQKSGYSTSLLDRRANEIYVNNWLQQINFYRYEIKKHLKK